MTEHKNRKQKHSLQLHTRLLQIIDFLTFDWENVDILDRKRFFSKRLISEMLHIKRQNNSLNL